MDKCWEGGVGIELGPSEFIDINGMFKEEAVCKTGEDINDEILVFNTRNNSVMESNWETKLCNSHLSACMDSSPSIVRLSLYAQQQGHRQISSLDSLSYPMD